MKKEEQKLSLNTPASDNESKLAFARFLACGFGSGFASPAPGTWGSLLALVIVFILLQFFPVLDTRPGMALLLLITSIAGLWSSSLVCKHDLLGSSKKDPKEVVIDEFAGLYMTYLIAGTSCPSTLWALFSGFLSFRLFDILKPPPIRYLERFPNGLGIMIDDLAAAVYAGLSLLVINSFL